MLRSAKQIHKYSRQTREQEGNGPIDFGRQGLGKVHWLDLARKSLVAAFQWWPPRLRMRPRHSVTLVASKWPQRSSVNLFLWFSGLKLPSFELVRDRPMTPPILLPLRSLGYEPLTSCLRPK